MANDHFKVRKKLLVDCLTCPLCTSPYKEATTICVCLHTFCKQCICQNLDESQNNCCPVCKADLGSFPEQLLRADHNLCELVLQFFPSKTVRRQENLSVPPQVDIVTPRISGLDAPEETVLPQNFTKPQAIQRVNHDDGEFVKPNIDLNQTQYNSSNHSAKALKKKINCDVEVPEVDSVTSASVTNFPVMRNKDPDQNRLSCSEEDDNSKTVACKIASKPSSLEKKNKRVIKTKKTKKMKSKICPLSGPKCDNRMIAVERSSQGGVRRSFDPGRQCDQASPVNDLPNKAFHPVWFCLLASEEKTAIALPQIQKPYIRIMNGDLTLSFINKYLVQKLNLNHESEVELLCCDHLLIPTFTLKDLVDIWVQATSNIGPQYINCNEGEPVSKNFVVELTYRSSTKHRTTP